MLQRSLCGVEAAANMLCAGSEKAADAEKPHLSHLEGTQTVEGCAAPAQRNSPTHRCSQCLHCSPSCCSCQYASMVHASTATVMLPAGLDSAKLLEQKHQQCNMWQFAVVTERQLASSGLLAILVSAICLQLAMPGGSSAAETPLPIEAFKSFLVSLPGHAIWHAACQHPGRWHVCTAHASRTDRLDEHSTAVTIVWHSCLGIMGTSLRKAQVCPTLALKHMQSSAS